MRVFEWDTKNPKQKQVLKLPYENVWVDHISIELLRYFKSFILKKIRKQKIGSHIGISNIHGEEYSLYRLIPLNIGVNSSINDLLKQKSQGIHPIIKLSYGIVFDKIYTDMGNIYNFNVEGEECNLNSLSYSKIHNNEILLMNGKVLEKEIIQIPIILDTDMDDLPTEILSEDENEDEQSENENITMDNLNFEP